MIRINLLPVRAEKRKEHTRKHILLLGLYVIFLAVVLVGVQLTMKSIAEANKKTIEKQKADITKLDQTIKEVQNYNAKLADLTDKLNVVIGLEQRQRGPAKVYAELSKVTPEKVWIEKISDNGGLVTIDGWAMDQQTIAQYMMNLESSTLFSSVRLKITKKGTKGGIDLQQFTLEVNLVPPGGQPAASKAGTPPTAAPAPAPAPTPAPAPAKPAGKAG